MNPSSSVCAIAAVLATSAVVYSQSESALPPGFGQSADFAWTPLTPARDSRLIFVSSSHGNDANDGRAPARAVCTIAHGKTLLRHEHPDWLLLRRGDTFRESLGQWKLSGRSIGEPIVVASYGHAAPRPVLECPEGAYFGGGGGAPPRLDHIAIVGLAFSCDIRDPEDPDFLGVEAGGAGITWLRPGSDILFEDCAFRHFKTGMVIQGEEGGVSSVRIRACQILDSYGYDFGEGRIARSSGLYAVNVQGLLIEGCLFDHNGWHDSLAGAHRTIFNHNLYIDDEEDGYGRTLNVTILDNVIARASSHGLQLRPGGTVAGNVFVDNPIGMFAALAPTTVADNLFLGAADIAPDQPRGWAVETLPCSLFRIRGNIVAHKPPGVGNGAAFRIAYDANAGGQVPVYHVAIGRGNAVFDWNGQRLGRADAGHARVSMVQGGIIDSGFVEAGRSLATYDTATGGTGSVENLLARVRRQYRGAWRRELAAAPIAEYIRAGFQTTGDADSR